MSSAKGKLRRFAIPTSTTQQVANLLTMPDETRQPITIGSIESISLARIRLDPGQPRKHKVDFLDPASIADDDPDREDKEAELAALRELAASIADHGLLQEVGVYMHGNDYALCWGERRVLAHRLLGYDHINAKILPDKPEKLRAKQFIENIHRADLTLPDLASGLRSLVEESGIDKATELEKTLAISYAHAKALFAIAKAPDDVMAAIQARRITSVRDAYRICSIEDGEARRHAIEIAAGEAEPEATPLQEAPAVPPATKIRARGRPVNSISLGKTKSGRVARFMVERLLEPKEFQAFNGADWDDLKVAGDIMKQVLKMIESKLAKAGK